MTLKMRVKYLMACHQWVARDTPVVVTHVNVRVTKAAVRHIDFDLQSPQYLDYSESKMCSLDHTTVSFILSDKFIEVQLKYIETF